MAKVIRLTCNSYKLEDARKLHIKSGNFYATLPYAGKLTDASKTKRTPLNN